MNLKFITLLETLNEQLEEASILEAERNQMDNAAAHLLCAEMFGKIKTVQVAIIQNNQQAVKDFYYG
jgi:hypothetical protein